MAAQSEWTIDYEGDAFERFYLDLPPYEQAVLTAAIEHVLQRMGMDICKTEWGKPLGEGLYEFRVRRSLQAILSLAGVEVPEDAAGADREVLLRVFCTFHGAKIVLLFSGYDKQSDSSSKRQQREIAEARKMLRAWKQVEAARAAKEKKKTAPKRSKKKRK